MRRKRRRDGPSMGWVVVYAGGQFVAYGWRFDGETPRLSRTVRAVDLLEVRRLLRAEGFLGPEPPSAMDAADVVETWAG